MSNRGKTIKLTGEERTAMESFLHRGLSFFIMLYDLSKRERNRYKYDFF